MHIGATGLVCPVGFNSATACAAIRAGMTIFAELPFWDKNAKPVIGAAVPGLDLLLLFRHRVVDMLAMALQDCLSRAPPLRLQDVPLLVGLAELGRPGGDEWSTEEIVSQAEKKLAVRFHPNLSQVIAGGHTSGFECLRIARDLMRTAQVPVCLVCGTDSYINAGALYWLDTNWRLKREGHSDGVIPGEAAAAILVQQQPVSNGEPEVTVAGLGFAQENAPIASEKPLRAEGLASACKSALSEANWGFHDLDFRISDATGENYGFREMALAEGRLARVVRSQPQPLWHVADAIGDTGGAAGVVQLVIARASWTKAFAPGMRAGCFTSSVQGKRAVALLQSDDTAEG